MLSQACTQFAPDRTARETCIRCGWPQAGHGTRSASVTAPKLTKIWPDTIRPDVCRASCCGQSLYYAQNVKTGRWTPFNTRPVAIAVQPEIETAREIWTIDLAQTISHFATCKDALMFRKRRR
jgi:hypothetical protein